MPMDRLSLMRCIELLQLPLDRRLRKIEQDARKSLVKELFGPEDGGGDFYSEFWADAKQKAANDDFDIHQSTQDRIYKNKSKRRLYPILLRGFLQGWARIREHFGLDAKVEIVNGLTAELPSSAGSDRLIVKNNLSIRTNDKKLIVVYPYFSKNVSLGGRHAAMALAAMKAGFEKQKPQNVAIFDVLRGSVFFETEVKLPEDGASILIERYDAVMREWHTQRGLISKGL